MDGSRSSGHRPGYVFAQETPPALQAAMVIAMATLPGVNLTLPGREEHVRVVLDDLVRAVERFADEMKRRQEPPEHVLIALKTMLRRASAVNPHDPATSEELQRTIVLAAIKSYFGQTTGIGQTDATRRVQEEHAGDRRVILVVDDDEDARFIAKSYLTAYGYGVVLAADGREVMGIARRVRPAAILLDILMPHLDGRTVLQYLQHDASTRAIPVIAVMGVQEIAESPELVASGFVDVLLKPVRQVEILRAIEAAVAARPAPP